MLQRSRNALARWPDQQRGEEFYGMGGWKDERTREEEERNGTDELQFSRLLAPRRTTCFTRRALDGRAEDGITSQVWEAAAAAVHSLARSSAHSDSSSRTVRLFSNFEARPSSAHRVFPRPSRQPLNFIFFRSPAPDAHDRSLTCLLGRESKTKACLSSLPPSIRWLSSHPVVALFRAMRE